MIDLHTHSNISDGELNPAHLAEKAALLGLKALALTDHDAISGLEEAEKAAKIHKMYFIPGVELEIQPELQFGEICNKLASSFSPKPKAAFSKTEVLKKPQLAGGFSGPKIMEINGEFHLLGLGIDRLNREFLAFLEYQSEARKRRNLKMVEKIRSAGIQIDYGEIKAIVGKTAKHDKGLIGRPHFADFLVSRKIVKTHGEAFKRWLGKGKPFYAAKEGVELGEAVRLIHQAGGAAVLAHPMSLYVSWGRMPGLLAFFKEKGLDGVEAWHPNARVNDCKRLEELGRSLGLFITAGSDFHGQSRPERKLGYTAGNQKIGDEFLEGFLAYTQRI